MLKCRKGRRQKIYILGKLPSQNSNEVESIELLLVSSNMCDSFTTVQNDDHIIHRTHCYLLYVHQGLGHEQIDSFLTRTGWTLS